MDNNLRDRVEKILRKYCSSSCCFGHEEEATALCSLIEEREIEARKKAIEDCKIELLESHKPKNENNVVVIAPGTLPNISFEILKPFYEIHKYSLELMQRACDNKLQSQLKDQKDKNDRT